MHAYIHQKSDQGPARSIYFNTDIMKFSFQTASLLTAIWFSTANAFPHMLFDVAKREGLDVDQVFARLAATDASDSDVDLRARVLGASPGFSADAQRISVTGANAFVAPGPGDIRGPCPGLNALANHNYIPHNGVPTFAQAIAGTTKGKQSPIFTPEYISHCANLVL